MEGYKSLVSVNPWFCNNVVTISLRVTGSASSKAGVSALVARRSPCCHNSRATVTRTVQTGCSSSSAKTSLASERKIDQPRVYNLGSLLLRTPTELSRLDGFKIPSCHFAGQGTSAELPSCLKTSYLYAALVLLAVWELLQVRTAPATSLAAKRF
jgi:hypothetical protein